MSADLAGGTGAISFFFSRKCILYSSVVVIAGAVIGASDVRAMMEEMRAK